MNLLKNNLKKLLFAIFITSSCLSFSQSTTTISPETEHQTIEGWGVSLAWWANLAGNWSQATIDELAGYAANDLNLNVYRFNIGAGENPNCTAGDHMRKDGGKMPGYRSPKLNDQGWGVNNLNNDYRQINVLDKIAALRASKGDIITEMISYSPPWWMTYGECTAGNVYENTENLKTEFIDDFADYLASVTADLNTAHPQWNIKYIVPFNEPTSGWWKKGVEQDGSNIYPTTQANVLWHLWQKKNLYGIGHIGLAGSDSNSIQNAIDNMTTLKNNYVNQYNGLDKINTHSYHGTWQEKGQLANFAQNNGNKPIWQTESGPLYIYPPSGFEGQWWIHHYMMAYRIIEDMRNLKTTVWCDWQLLSFKDSWGMIQQTNWNENTPNVEPTLRKTRGFYAKKNFTNFIKVGYKIIDTNNGNTVAALSPDGSELAIVMVNATGTANATNFDLSKFSGVQSFKTYRTSGNVEGIGEDTTLKTNQSITEKGVLSGNTLSYTAPPFSVTTFAIKLAGNNVPDGNYNIKAEYSNKYMSVTGFSSTNGAQIEQWGYVNQDNLRFNLTKGSDGFYKIKPIYNNKVLTAITSAGTGARFIQLQTDIDADNQKFRLEPLGNNEYRITPKFNLNKALAVAGNGLQNGDDIISFNFLPGYANFRWKFIPSNTSKTASSKTLGIDENLDSEYAIYPNPVEDGKLTVKIANGEPNNMEIFDIYGKSVYKIQINQNEKEIELNKKLFTSGLYLVKFSSLDGTRINSKKLIVK